MKLVRSRRSGAGLIGVLAALVIVGPSVISAVGDDSVQGANPLEVRSDGATDDALYPWLTAADWVTYADHVVVATVTGEQGFPGNAYQGRDVTMRIDRTVWSAEDPRRVAPKTLTWNMWGWRAEGGKQDRPIRIAIEQRPRLEVGHTYVLPLRWEVRCGEDDGRPSGRWITLAGEAIYPYDTATIGTGEVSGRFERAADNVARLDSRWLHSGLRKEMNGRSAEQLTATLQAASPVEEKHFGANAFCKDSPKTP